MDLSTANLEGQKATVWWGRVGYAVSGAVISGFGYRLLPDARGWINIILGGILLTKSFTYRPRPSNKTLDDAMGLAWAVVVLCTVPPLLIIMMCIDGTRCSVPLMWGMLLASIFGPAVVVWKYFRRRKS